MTRKRGLGRGLDALIPPGEGSGSGEGGILQVPLYEISRNPRQPRSDFDVGALEELAESIRRHGVLQPLLATRDPSGTGYILIAGERRWLASQMAGIPTIPVILRPAHEQQRLELALIENLQRTDLGPLDCAEGYRQLAEDFDLSHDEIAERLGKSRVAVTNTLRLLKLPPSVRDALASGKISEGHARALLALPSPQAQAAALKAILDRGLSVRQTEDLVRRLTGRSRPSLRRRSRSPEESALEEQLRQLLGTRVILRRGRRGGSLEIYFYSDEELNTLVDRILRTE